MSHSSLSAFAGTADDYLRYRPAYPLEFLSELRTRAQTSGSGALLDLACGPGRVAIPMAPHFQRVLAVDAEAEMIAVGQREAHRRGVVNIAWQVQRAAGLDVDGYEYAVERVWTCDSIVGFMFSTSIASRRVLGDAAGRFEADLRGALLECEPSGRFVCAQRFGFTLGRRVE